MLSELTRGTEMHDRSYFGLMKIDDYISRFHYLKIGGGLGEETFGWARQLNQGFYRSREWRKTRDAVIVRDEGMDMAFYGRPIRGKIIVHHIMPITLQHIEQGSDLLLDMNNLVCVSHLTHNAIHYGDESLLPKDLVERSPGDTKLW